MNNILDDLEKITNSCINGNFQRNDLCICSRCTLKNSEYSLCFYINTLKKNIDQKGVVIMFISRDPNIDVNTVRNVNYKTIDIVLKWKEPKKIGLGNFFYDFLYESNCNSLWSEFLDYLEVLKNTGSSNIVTPRFYWTHLVKCYAENNANIVNQAKEHCIDYLKEEIEAIKPQLIITAGKDVLSAVASISSLHVSAIDKIKDINAKILAAYQNKNPQIICIPHPSQAPYQMWKNGTKDFGIKFKDLKNLINNLIC